MSGGEGEEGGGGTSRVECAARYRQSQFICTYSGLVMCGTYPTLGGGPALVLFPCFGTAVFL